MGPRFRFGERTAWDKREEPHNPAAAIFHLYARKQFTFERGNDSRKEKMGRALREMIERTALHIHKGFFARRMHDFQDKGVRI